MPTVDRLTYAPVEGAAELFTPGFCDYFVAMHDTFAPRVAEAREDAELPQVALFLGADGLDRIDPLEGELGSAPGDVLDQHDAAHAAGADLADEPVAPQ